MRRRAGRAVAASSACALFVAPLLAGCGQPGRRIGPIPGSTTTTSPFDLPLPTTPVTPPGPPPASSDTTEAPGPGGTSPATTRGTKPGTTVAPADPIASAATGPVGSFARTLLAAAPAGSDVLDVIVGSGAAPTDANLEHARARLATAAGKPVFIATSSITASVADRDSNALIALADAGQSTPQGNGRAVLRILFLHGRFVENGAPRDDVLGVAVRGDTIAVFEDVIARSAGLTVPATRIEESVVLHEIGHALGLVDLVLHSGREDKSHPGHSPNPKSVMYFAVESDPLSALLGGPPPIEFDDADRADLATIRGS